MTGGTDIAPATIEQSCSTEKGGEPGDDGTELRDGAFKAETVAARWWNRAARYRRWLRSSFRRRRREMDGGEGVRSMTEKGRRSSRVMGGMGSRLAVVWS
ncbi:hypothetical protein S245_021299 [Arachis hypogaea]